MFKFSQEEISEKYTTPLVNQLENINIAECLDSNDSAETITNLLLQNSVSLAKKNFKTNKKNEGFVRLTEEVKVALYHGKAAFDDWKQLNFPLEGDAHDIYRAKRKDYRSKLPDFLNHLEADKIKNLCNAADCNEKLFWKLLKGQKSFSKMSAFLVNGNLLTDRNVIRDMWADHFEALGTPTENEYFDNAFLSRVVSGVREIFDSCTNNPFRVLCEPLDYDEVAWVCSELKLGVTGLCIDYEHIRFAGPPVWRLLFEMYQNFYANGSVCESWKTGVILPLLKGKGAKANYKDNYRGITLFPTLCKIYEMVLLNRLENYAKQNRLFSNLQFGFQEGVGCTEASSTILESINHMLERGSKVFGCFLDVHKAFDTVWIDGLLYKLFTEFDIRGRMWLAIKDLYTEVRGQVFYSSTLSRKFDISQGTGQGRILAPFMYKVYINSLLNELTNHCYAISKGG